MEFFNTVHYYQLALIDNGYMSKFESAANVCLAPTQWLSEDLFGKQTKYTLIKMESQSGFYIQSPDKKTEGFRKVIRVIVGLLLALPGLLFAIPLKAIAYSNEEIRLKNQIKVLFDHNDYKNPQQTLVELIAKRKKLTDERQGCDPIVSPSLLCTICCLLCCLVCKK